MTSSSSVCSLISACRENRLPTVRAMSDFGIQNASGINPLHIFECYRMAITRDGVKRDSLEHALKNDRLDSLIMNSPSVRGSQYYKIVAEIGGFVNGYIRGMDECDACARVVQGGYRCDCLKI